MEDKLRLIATDETGWRLANSVWEFNDWPGELCTVISLVEGLPPSQSQRIVYVDGDFDLFCPGHAEFLRLTAEEETRNHKGSKYAKSSLLFGIGR
jgi:hypothetical protein